MRIISGIHKGRRIAAPKGLTARPTTDRIRESVFGILEARSTDRLTGARVIDLFAGSGALGLEAMSRGADWCLFVDINAAARAAIRENIEALGLFGSTRIHRRSATALGPRPASAGDAFEIAFVDPPYRQGLCEPALASLAAGAWLAPEALAIVEQAKNEPPARHDAYKEIDRRQYGDTQIGFYQFSQR